MATTFWAGTPQILSQVPHPRRIDTAPENPLSSILLALWFEEVGLHLHDHIVPRDQGGDRVQHLPSIRSQNYMSSLEEVRTSASPLAFCGKLSVPPKWTILDIFAEAARARG